MVYKMAIHYIITCLVSGSFSLINDKLKNTKRAEKKHYPMNNHHFEYKEKTAGNNVD